jgi:hypothetical protein
MGHLGENSWQIKYGSFVPRKIANAVNLHSKGLGKQENLFAEQFMYGHREILLQFLGLDSSVQFIGNLQHGTFYPGAKVDFRTPSYLWGRQTKYWVFSKQREENAKSQGFSRVRAIGAPWCYIPKNLVIEKNDTGKSRKEGKVLIMPMHSQGDAIDQTPIELKRKRVELFREAIDGQNATVCLHYFDYLDESTRNLYAQNGFEVTCLGLGAVLPPWSPATGRQTFLLRLMKLMSEHEYFLTDGFGTQLFYALDMGMRIRVETEIGRLLSIGSKGHETETDSEIEMKMHTQVFFEKSLPNALGKFSENNQYREISDAWLGRDCQVNSKQLITLLDFRKDIYPKSDIRLW